MKNTASYEQLRAEILSSPGAKQAYEEAKKEFELIELLREIKTKAKLTRKEIATRLSLSTSTVRRIEYYPTNVRIEHLIRYAQVCNADINFSISYKN